MMAPSSVHGASLLSEKRVSCSCSTSCSSSSLSNNNGHNLSLCSTVARRQRHLGHGGSFSGGHFLKKGVPWVQHVLTHPHMGRASRPEEHAKAKHVSVRLQIPNEDRQVVAQDEAARMVVVGNTEELGHWDVASAVPMSQVNGVWLTDVALPAGTRVEYKYVAMRDGGDAHWWPGDNLVLTVPEGENLPPRYVACDNLSGRSTRFVAAVDNDHSTGAEVPFSEWIRHGGAAPALAAAAAGGAVLTAAAMSMMQNGPPFSAEHWRTFASLSSVDRPMPTSSARSRLVPPSEMTLGASVVTTVRTRVADASRVVGSEVANLVEQVRRTPDKNTPAYKANEKREERFREGLADLSEDLGYYMRYTTWLAHVSLLHLRFAAMRVAYEAEVAGHSMASAAQSYAYEHAGAWSTNAVEAIALTKEWCVDQATGFGVFVSDWRTAGAMATAAATFAAMGEHVKMLASFLAANPSTAGQLFAVVAGGAVLSLAVRKSLLASRLTHAPAVDAPPSPDASAATTESESREATSATILRDIGRNVQLKLEERIQLLRELVEAKEMTIHSSMQTLIETQEQSEMLRRNLDKTARQRDELSGEVERLKEALLESTAQSSRTSSVSPSSTAYREPMSHALNIDPIVTKRFAELQLRYEERKAKEEEH